MTVTLDGVPFGPPLFISGRLMAAVKVEDASGHVGTLHLHAGDRDSEGRIVYHWLVEDAAGAVLGEGHDLRSGVREAIDYRGSMGTLCGFLSACGESYAYKMRNPTSTPENLDLFPEACAEWAYQNFDELSMLGIELEEGFDGE